MKQLKCFLKALSIENFFLALIFLSICLICEGPLYLKYINQFDSNPNNEQYLLNKADYYKELSVMFKNAFWVIFYIFLTIILVRIIIAVISAVIKKMKRVKQNENNELAFNQNSKADELHTKSKINVYNKISIILSSFTIITLEVAFLLKSKMYNFLLDSIERGNRSNIDIVNSSVSCNNAGTIFYIITAVLLALNIILFSAIITKYIIKRKQSPK